jgi:HEAT repeat protein
MKQMKIKYFLTVILGVIINSINIAQNLTQDQKNNILSALTDSSLNYRSAALDAVIKYNLNDATEILTNNFWDESRTLQVKYLKVFEHLNFPLTNQFALNLLDTILINPSGGSSVYPIVEEMRAQVANILIDIGNYSKVQYIFDLIEINKPEVSSEAITILPKIIEKIPEFENEAKNELIFVAINSDFEMLRFNSLVILLNYYGVEVLPLFLERLKNDSSISIRSAIVNQFLPTNDPNVTLILRERLFQELSPIVRKQIAQILLLKHGSISDYLTVYSYLSNESDTTVHFLIQNSLASFTPIQPIDSLVLETSIDSLAGMVDQCNLINWLDDLTLSNDLKNILTTAKINLQNGDSLACRVQVKAFQDLVDNVYKDSLNSDPRFVTIEGWKFLYWNAQYILERLPKL